MWKAEPTGSKPISTRTKAKWIRGYYPENGELNKPPTRTKVEVPNKERVSGITQRSDNETINEKVPRVGGFGKKRGGKDTAS